MDECRGSYYNTKEMTNVILPSRLQYLFVITNQIKGRRVGRKIVLFGSILTMDGEKDNTNPRNR